MSDTLDEALQKLLEDYNISDREKENLKKIHDGMKEVRRCIVDNMLPPDLTEPPPNPGSIEARLHLFFMNEANMAFGDICKAVRDRWPAIMEAVKESVEEDPFSKLIKNGKLETDPTLNAYANLWK